MSEKRKPIYAILNGDTNGSADLHVETVLKRGHSFPRLGIEGVGPGFLVVRGCINVVDSMNGPSLSLDTRRLPLPETGRNYSWKTNEGEVIVFRSTV